MLNRRGVVRRSSRPQIPHKAGLTGVQGVGQGSQVSKGLGRAHEYPRGGAEACVGFERCMWGGECEALGSVSGSLASYMQAMYRFPYASHSKLSI